jgi:prepilin-type N-terminal cleavage/methylation domain-containing protein
MQIYNTYRVKDCCEAENGFTLLETLVALAILSVASLALFQSTANMLSLSDRAVSLAERTVDDAVARRVFRASVDNLTPSWPEYPEHVFQGDAHTISAISDAVPRANGEILAPFSWRLQINEPNRVSLVMDAKSEHWDVYEFRAQAAAFSYLGVDQNWYDIWPPRDVPSNGFFDDVKTLDMPQFPLAVRLTVQTDAKDIVWIAPISANTILPIRDELGRDLNQ